MNKPNHVVSRINLSKYTPHNYVDVVNRKGWIDYGVNNDYPDYLIDLSNESPTHHALINSIAYMIFGAGVESSVLDEYKFNDTLLKNCIEFKIHGYFFLEIVRSGSSIKSIEHIPTENVRCGERVGRVIPNFWYSDNWGEIGRPKNKPQEIRAFSNDPSAIASHPRQILMIRPFCPGSFYYSKPDYIGAVEYAELEKRIGTFHNSAIKNGLAPSYIIKLKKGEPDPEQKTIIEREIRDGVTGESVAGSVLIFYNNPGEETPEVETVQVTDLDKQYQFLSTESTEKIMIGHRVVSPLMFGVRDGGGLGSNSDELKQAADLMNQIVIIPFREVILRGLAPLFQSLNIAEPIWGDKVGVDAAEVDQSYTGIQITSAIDIISRVNIGALTQDQGSTLIEQMLGFSPEIAIGVFKTKPINPTAVPTQLSAEIPSKDAEAISNYLDECGEVIDLEEWELVQESEVDYINDDDDQIEGLNTMFKFASVLSSNPNGKSEQDNDLFKVRYGYAPSSNKSNSRSFCVKMVSAGKVYRKEDIEAAGDRSVNPGFGPEGTSTYDIWFYKGGARCHHFWERKIYMRKNNKKITVSEAQLIIKDISPKDRDQYRLPVNDGKVARLPNDMPNNGFLKPR